MPVKSSTDIAWLAGLLEGEGSFSILENGTAPQIKLAMNDSDIVQRAKFLTNHPGPVNTALLKSGNTSYIINICGNLAIQWMMTIYTLMGIRRKAKIREILLNWRGYEREYKQFCVNNHEYIPENTYIMPNGYRTCITCRKEANVKAQEKRTPEIRKKAELMTFLVSSGLSKEQAELKMKEFEELGAKNESH